MLAIHQVAQYGNFQNVISKIQSKSGMLLKKENKLIFQSHLQNDHNRRSSSSASKRSLVKIPSTSKLPQDFYRHSEDIFCVVKNSDKRDCSISKKTGNDSLLFTFQGTNSVKCNSEKLMKKPAINYDQGHHKIGLQKCLLQKNKSSHQLPLLDQFTHHDNPN